MDVELLRSVYRGVGSLAYDPVLMLSMVLYEYVNGRTSPATWFRGRRKEGAITLKWLGYGINPSRTVWYDFRDRLGPIIQKLCDGFVRYAMERGFVSGEIVAQDGTFVRANATRHHLLNKARLKDRIDQLRVFIAQDEQAAKAGLATSTTELPAWMGATSRGRRRQLRGYLIAQEQLEIELAENAQRPKSKRAAIDKVKIAPTDPEATLGRDKEKVYCPLYNVQYVVEFPSRVILTYGVYSQANDCGTLIPMLDQLREITKKYPKWKLTDSSYVSILDLKDCKQRGTTLVAPYQENSFTAEKKKRKPPKQFGKEMFQWSPVFQTYTCPQGHQLDFERCGTVKRRNNEPLKETRYRCPAIYCQACPLAQQCCRNPKEGRTIKRLEGEEYLTAHQEYMKTEEAKQLYRKRGSIIELPYADLKQHRNGRRLHSRGLKRVTAEIGLYVLAQNFMTLNRLETQHVNSSQQAA